MYKVTLVVFLIRNMDTKTGENSRERAIRRPVRSKRYSRRPYGEERRPPKRLFTPEIKRFLKDWLIRRRDNPYPNRDEKKMLAVQTGLTYIQVCNWFANWRRKLKNAGKEPQQRTWGELIKTYNTQVQGNVEHFSICSDDSIWQETEDSFTFKNYEDATYFNNNNNNTEMQNQCFYISSTTESEETNNPFSQPSNKYKNQIIEKYLRDCQKPETNLENNKPSMISKWLESAANFKPNKNSYIEWSFDKPMKKKSKKSSETCTNLMTVHGREELDAAEALTTLANSRFKI